MAKRKSKPAPSAKPRLGIHSLILTGKIALALAAVLALLYTLGYAGKSAGLHVASDPRYRVPIAEVQLDPPPPIVRAVFLTEVRSLGNLPEAVSSVDPATMETLKAAFGKHPWVKDVNEIAVDAEGKLRAKLTYRRPALAIHIQGENGLRVVDGTGVLLPESALAEGVPTLLNQLLRTETPAGQRYADPDVPRAAELVGIHLAKTIERTRDGWRIVEPTGRLLRIAAP